MDHGLPLVSVSTLLLEDEFQRVSTALSNGQW